MFAFDRSAAAVLMPLALLVAVVLWSNHGHRAEAVATQSRSQAQSEPREEGEPAQTVAANLPSR